MERKDTTIPIGTEVQHNGQPLRIVQLLSIAGWTSEVYQGELGIEPTLTQVAVKVMKALDMPMARQLFEQEGLTLAAMMYHEEEANKEQRLALKVAPVYYGIFEYNNLPCLVMEFIQGEAAPRLMEKTSKLPELQALTIAWHLYRTLDILHTRVKKTYIDLKFEDLWWVTDGPGGKGQLKLMDFGTLEDIRPGDSDPRGVRRDLLLAGVYLCGMLTGHMLNYSLGELRERAEPLLNRAEMTWGTRRLLRRLLHRNPAVRPTSAAGVVSELRTLVSFWEQPVERLYEIADNNLSRAQAESDLRGSRAQEYAGRARSALDLVRFQPGYDESRLARAIQQAEDFLQLSNYVERGRALFNGRAYDDARSIFEEGRHWSDAPALLRRWAYLAQIGQDVTPDVFDQHREAAVDAVERLNDGKWRAAQERLSELAAPLASPGLQALQADRALFASLEQAEAAGARQAFAEAAAAYRAALENLNKLPDADFVQQEEVGDLRSAAEEMERLSDTRGQARRVMDEALGAIGRGDDEQAIALAWQAYVSDWQDRAVQEKYARLLQEAQRSGRATAILRLAEIGLRDALLASPELAALRSLSWLLWQAEQALLRADYATMGRCLITATANPALAQFESTLPAVRALLVQASQQAAQARDELGLSEIACIGETVGFEDSSQWAEDLRRKAAKFRDERQARQRQAVDRLLVRAGFLLNLNQPGEADGLWPAADLAALMVHFHQRFDEADRLLGDAAGLARDLDGYRLDEIEALRSRRQTDLQAQQQTDEQRRQIRRQAQETRWVALQQEWDLLQVEREWLYGRGAANIDPSVRRTSLERLQDRLLSFISSSYAYLEHHDQGQQEVRERIDWALEALDGVGEAGWQSLQNEASARLQRLQGHMGEITHLFEAGELAQAAATLDRTKPQYGSAPEWQSLHSRVSVALAWQAWLDQYITALEAGQPDRNLLADLHAYGEAGLPKTYRCRPEILKYLQKVRYTFQEAIRKGVQDYHSPAFPELINFRLKFEEIARLFEKDEGHASA